MRTLTTLALLVGLVAGPSLVDTGRVQAQSGPASLPLVTASNLRYLGAFRLPGNDGSGASPSGELMYGGAGLSISPGGLFIVGHDQAQRLCEVSIPSIGGTAAIRQRCVDVTEGRLPQVDSGAESKLGGTLVWNGRLIVSAYSYYDADVNQQKSHFASGTTLSATGDVAGPVQVGTAGAGFVSGYMGVIPAEWRASLGGPALTGNCCLSIISRTSSGPAVSVFNPDDVGRVSPVPATRVLAYPIDNPLAAGTSRSDAYVRGDQIGGMAFPAGTRSVLFFGKHGTGDYCYGEAAACGDPVRPYKGDHAYPYVNQVWAYDANDLVAVKNGTKQAWAIRPYAMWRLTEINNNGNASIAGVTYDPATRRVYVTEAYGPNPSVHVYEITSAVSETNEICGDGIDNDRDGQVDEGCAPPNPPSPPAPEVCGDGIDNDRDGQVDEGCVVPSPPTPPAPEACGDGVDNDRDGQIDEGCPGTPQRLTGQVQGNRHVSLSWLAPIVGAQPTEYIVQAGVAPGQAMVTFSAGLGTSTRVQNVGRGRYYVSVRAKNAAGLSAPSNEVTLSVGCSTAPNPLTNLITAVRGGLVTMSWTDPDGCTDTSYRVAVADSAGRPIGVVPTSSNAVTALAGPGVYQVSAQSVSNLGQSALTAPAQLVINSGACVPPQFATHLVGQVVNSNVFLAWSPVSIADALQADAVAPVAYWIEVGSQRGAADVLRIPLGRFTALGTPAPTGTYHVRIRPADVCGFGQPSNEVTVQVP